MKNLLFRTGLAVAALSAMLSAVDGYTALGEVIIKTENFTATYRSAKTAFGPKYGWKGYELQGMAVLQKPRNPCEASDYRPAWSVGDNSTKKIALMSNAQQGSCSVDTAVWAMQEAGYDGVIIYNPINDLLYVLGGAGVTPSPIEIPTVFVGLSCGSLLLQYQSRKGVEVDLKINGLVNLTLYLIPLACVVAVCIIVVITFLCVRWCLEVRRRQRSRLSKSNLKKIPVIKFKSSRDVYETCAICLDDYEDGDKLRVLPCKHAFHAACIDPWLLQQRRVCPCCKRRVMTSRGQPVVSQNIQDSDSSDTEDENRPLLRAPSSEAERRYLGPVYGEVTDRELSTSSSRDFWAAVNSARRRVERIDEVMDESNEEYRSIPVSRPSTVTSYGSFYSTPSQSPVQASPPNSDIATVHQPPVASSSTDQTTECDHQGACACTRPTVEVEGDVEDEDAPLIVKVQVEVPRKKKKLRKSGRNENGPI